MIEALVITACLQGKPGCSEAMNGYYSYNKEMQVIAKNVENYGNYVIRGRKWIVYVVTPLYAWGTGKPANIKLSKELTLTINPKEPVLSITWSY